MRRRGFRGLLFHQNPGGAKNLFRTALQEDGRRVNNGHVAFPHGPPMFLCSVLQEEDHQAFCQDLDSAAVQSLTFVACVDICKVSRVPPQVTAEPCPKSGDTTRSTIFPKYPATRTEKNRLCARQRVMSGIGGHALTLMTIMWWWWWYTSWPSQCNSEVLLPFINSVLSITFGSCIPLLLDLFM